MMQLRTTLPPGKWMEPLGVPSQIWRYCTYEPFNANTRLRVRFYWRVR
jgi:hypothetical protein